MAVDGAAVVTVVATGAAVVVALETVEGADAVLWTAAAGTVVATTLTVVTGTFVVVTGALGAEVVGAVVAGL